MASGVRPGCATATASWRGGIERAGVTTTGRGGATCLVGSGDGTGFVRGLARTIEPIRLAAAVSELVLRDGFAARARLTTLDFRDLFVALRALVFFRDVAFLTAVRLLALLATFFRDTAVALVRLVDLRPARLLLRLFGGVRDCVRALRRDEEVALRLFDRVLEVRLEDRTLFLAVCLLNRIPLLNDPLWV